MSRKTFFVQTPIRVMLFFSIILGLASSIHAGDILTTTWDQEFSYTASEFNSAPDGFLSGEFNLPRFDPSLGALQKVEITETLVSAEWSQIRVDSERADFGYGQYLMAGGWFWHYYPIVGPETGWTVGNGFGLLYGNQQHFELGWDDDVAPDFVGEDAASVSGATPAHMSKSDGTTINPMPGFSGPANENPAFIEFIQHTGDEPHIGHMSFNVASAMVSPFYADVEKLRTNGDVTIRAEVKYTYEVPEPATLALLAMGSLAIIRRHR